MEAMMKSRIGKALNPEIILRIGAGICFIGHGMLAIGAKAGFVKLLSTFGIEGVTALTTLTFIGLLDVTIGLFILLKPNKLVLRWAMLWTGLTILAWGIHGDSLMDLFRRVTYLTTPMALLVLLYSRVGNQVKESEGDGKTVRNLSTVTVKQEEAIANIDLSLICMKLMDPREGEGWSRQQSLEVAEEYRKYLKLKLLYPNANVVPNLAIDTMWHYHILDTEAYYNDCQAIFGYILHHYPYYGMGVSEETGDEQQLMSAFEQTQLLYEKTFDVPMYGPNYLPSFQKAS